MSNNNNIKKILFIQHATAFGGSAMSLLYTLQGIRKAEGDNCKLIVALAKWTETLADFYQSNGFEVAKADWIDTYEHTQSVSYNVLNPVGLLNEIKQIINIKKARKHTRLLVERIKPDIVHLNSVVLLGSAREIASMGIPLVWHVREPSVKGLFNIRTRIIIKALKTLPDRSIFICKADKKSWGNPENGTVVYNFVDFDKFNSSIKPNIEWGIDRYESSFNVLFLGGMNKVKGTIVMIRAFAELKKLNPEKNIKLLFAGGKYNKPDYFFYSLATKVLPRLGSGTYSQMVEKEIQTLNIESDIIRLAFVKEVAQIFALSHVLVFPSVRPHFARPIIEAGSMSLPVIGSSLGGVNELIEDGVNGYLCRANDVNCVTNNLHFLLNHPKARKQLGENGLEKARKNHSVVTNIKQITKIYNEVLQPSCI